MTQLLTTSELRRILNVDRTTVYRMAESGRLPAVRVGKQWRFPQTDIERWMEAQRGPVVQSALREERAVVAANEGSLANVLPLECVQATQDLVADLLGATVVVTDLHTRPVTRMSNVGALHGEILRRSKGKVDCLPGWLSFSELQANEFAVGPLSMSRVRGFVRAQEQLVGMVLVGGIAGDDVVGGVDDLELSAMAARVGASVESLRAHALGVHQVDAVGRARISNTVQRVADLFGRMAEDRRILCGKLQAIAALTVL